MTNAIPLVDISIQPIELCKLLKIANMVGGGGEAKIVISEGYVLLNDEVEYQKRKKVYHDDIIQFNGEIIQVNYVKANHIELKKAVKSSGHVVENKQNKINPSKQKKSKTQAENQQQSSKTAELPRAKRKPISF